MLRSPCQWVVGGGWKFFYCIKHTKKMSRTSNGAFGFVSGGVVTSVPRAHRPSRKSRAVEDFVHAAPPMAPQTQFVPANPNAPPQAQPQQHVVVQNPLMTGLEARQARFQRLRLYRRPPPQPYFPQQQQPQQPQQVAPVQQQQQPEESGEKEAAEFEAIKQKAAAESEQQDDAAATAPKKEDDIQIIAQEVDDVRALLEKYRAQLEARVSVLEKQLAAQNNTEKEEATAVSE